MAGDMPPSRGMYESPSFQPMNSGGGGGGSGSGGMGGMDGGRMEAPPPSMSGRGRPDPQWNDQHPQDMGGPPPDQMRSGYGMYPMQR
eukprot:scaffold648276_cov41-Prasinocladus_malaysianus.AAC.1